MKKKYGILVSIILLVISIGLCVCGILLFNNLPDVNSIGYTNPKDAIVAAATLFTFIFAFVALCGSVGFLIYTFIGEN